MESSRAVIGHTTVEKVRSAKGKFLPFIYAEPNPVTGKTMWGLGPHEFELVRNGYACPECLWDFGGIIQPACPICGHELDINVDIKAEPDYWKPDPNDPYRNA